MGDEILAGSAFLLGEKRPGVYPLCTDYKLIFNFVNDE